MRRILTTLTALCVAACVKAPHEAQLAYEEFDKAPDYVWRSYAKPEGDEARKAYWAGYQEWLCARAVDENGHWRPDEAGSVQRQVACDGYQRDQRREAVADRNESFQESVAAVELGMDEETVRSLIGRPSHIDQSNDPSDTQARWIYRDASRRRTILQLRFREGRLESLGN